MKKTGILILTLILIAAMFSGCRRQTTETTGTPATTIRPTTTQTTILPTVPSTTTVLPSGTQATSPSDATTATDMGRGRPSPRY